MNIRKISYIIIFSMIFSLFVGCSNGKKVEEEVALPVSYDQLMKQWKKDNKSEVVKCWYTSETDQKWLENAGKEFEKQYGIKVELVYYDGVEMFSDINQANQTENGPDLYLIGNDQLQLAKNSGLAEENTWLDEAFWKDNYPKVAKDAVTYHGKQYGYPIYFDTYCLVYDANLLENAPASIDEILAFADEYEDTGSTKAIFRWDVADPYINTMFIAAYANLFGENGDEADSFKINNEKSIEAMQYFQSLSAYFWMNKGNISHDTVKKRIMEKTLVLGLCKSDILPVLYEMNQETSKEETEESKDETNYQISYVPSLTAELSSTALSTTYSAMINPYGKNQAAGNMFALFLSYQNGEKQYAGNGKLPVINQKDKFDSMQTIIYAQYLNSEPVPKVIILGDYLSESGIVYDEIWDGKDVKEQLDILQEKMEKK